MTPKTLFFYPTRCPVGSLAAALSLTTFAACSASTVSGLDGATADAPAADLAPFDAGSPPAPPAPDAGSALTPEDEAFLDAFARADCTSTLCQSGNIGRLAAWHGSVEPCLRETAPFWEPVRRAIAEGVITIDTNRTAACLAEAAAICDWIGRAPSCEEVFVSVHPRATGATCGADAECGGGDRCATSGVVLGLSCPPAFHCTRSVGLGEACSSDGSVVCAEDPGTPTGCQFGHCTVLRDTIVAEGAACGGIAMAADGAAVFADCARADVCTSGASGATCTPRVAVGGHCGPGECVASAVCLGDTCGSPTYLHAGDTGCASDATGICDKSLGAFCDVAHDVCIAAGDGSLGTVCEPSAFPCRFSLVCSAGRCVERAADGTPCDASTPCLCGADGVCVACR